jgi:hypothetical protein
MSALWSEVKKYYEEFPFAEAEQKLGNEFLKFRQIQIFLSDGAVIKLRKRVSSWRDLAKTLAKFCDERRHVNKAYFMVGRFLNPETVGPRARQRGYMVADNCFLYQDEVVFDIDEDPEVNLRKLLTFFQIWGVRVVYVISSGQRGYHVMIKRNARVDFDNPLYREHAAMDFNGDIVSQIRMEGIDICNCSENPRQIYKIPQSVSCGNDGSANICVFVSSSRESKDNDGKHRLTALPWKPKSRTQTEPRLGGQRSGVSSPPSLDVKLGVRSSVVGTNGGHVTFYHFKTRQIDIAKIRAEKLIQIYHASDYHIYDNGRELIGVCNKIVSQRRLEKITRKKIRPSGIILRLNDLEYIMTVKGFESNHLSLGHAKIFGGNGTVGKPEVKLVRTTYG